MDNEPKTPKQRPPGGEGGWDEMLLIDGKEPDVSWTSRRLAMELGYSDQFIKMLGGEKLTSLSNRELDRYKVITELVEQIFARADAEGLELCLCPQSRAPDHDPESLSKLRRWALDIR